MSTRIHPVKTARVKLGWSQRDLADKADLAQNTISRIESYTITNTGVEEVVRMCLAVIQAGGMLRMEDFLPSDLRKQYKNATRTL